MADAGGSHTQSLAAPRRLTRLGVASLLAAALSTTAAPASSRAQRPAPTAPATAPAAPGALWIRVVDPTLTPVAGAELVLPLLGLSLRVPEGGALLLTGVPAGVYLVQARQVGYAPAWQTLRVGRDTVIAQLALGPAGQQLDTVTVRGTAVPMEPRLADFERRRAHGGFGHYIGRDEIDRRRPSDVANLLRGVPGIAVTTRGGTMSVASRRKVGASLCSGMLVFLDGALVVGRQPITGGVRVPAVGAPATGLSGSSGGYRPGTVGTGTSTADPTRGGPATTGTAGTTGGSGNPPTGTGTGTGTRTSGTTGGTFASGAGRAGLGNEPDWGAMAGTNGVSGAFDLNTIPTSLVAGVEVYTSIAGIPPEYAGFVGAECGVILLWTAAR